MIKNLVTHVKNNLLDVAFGALAAVTVAILAKGIYDEYQKAPLEAQLRILQDKNHDGILDFHEQADGWRRMGYAPVIEGDYRNYPWPSKSDLQRAINSYKSEQAEANR